MSRPGAPVVVGIDDVGSAEQAVDWAAAEAAARGCPLRIVRAFHPPLPADPYGIVPPVDGLFAARAAAEFGLRHAVTRARSVASDLDVSARLLRGPTVRALLDDAADARLLVLGSRGLCGLRGALARSVSGRVAAQASCPVVVIRPVRGPAQEWSPARVVVGVDASASCSRAVEFALQAARQRGVPLVVLHAWRPDLPADLDAVPAPSSAAEDIGRRLLDGVLDRWQCEPAGAAVTTTLVRDDPARALVSASRGAALVVVGSRGRGPLRGAVFGSVGRSVLRHGHSPVAVIGPDPATHWSGPPRRAVPPPRRADPPAGRR